MTFDDISTFYTANQTLIASLGALAGVAVLLLAANRLRTLKEHRATLLVANLLTSLAAALATAVSASGMWKFFTDILGETPLRIAFFAFIEIALFASALLARSRLLRDPQTGTTGIDGIAVWVLAALTATLSALDSDSFREVCLRLVAPLVAAWMWERALAAERNVRLGRTARRINWAITPERIFVWLRMAEARDRDVSQVDRARRRAKLGRARLHLHLLQSKESFAWRIRRAHRRVVKQAMQAAEHIGLADFPNATNERQAMQMYMATLYGFVEATSPQAVAHLKAWQTGPIPRHTETSGSMTVIAVPTATTVLNGTASVEDNLAGLTATGVNGAKLLTVPNVGQAMHDETGYTPEPSVRTSEANGRENLTSTAASELLAHQESEAMDRTQQLARGIDRRPADLDNVAQPTAGPTETQMDDTGELRLDEELIANEFTDDNQSDEEVDITGVEAMRRFWDREVAEGRVPTGAELSRAAGVPPATGLGRRKRREWEAELPERLKISERTVK